MYRRFVLLIMFVAVGMSLVIVTSPAQAQATTPVTATITGSVLLVRSGPGISNALVGSLPRGTVVTVLGRDSAGTWLQIRTTQGLVGWVSSFWVKLTTGSVLDLPVVASPATAQSATTITGETATVLPFQLSVRSGPGTTNPRLGHLSMGTVVTVLGRNSAGTWLKVQTTRAWQAGYPPTGLSCRRLTL
jgi:uncharacterized protein YraI